MCSRWSGDSPKTAAHARRCSARPIPLVPALDGQSQSGWPPQYSLVPQPADLVVYRRAVHEAIPHILVLRMHCGELTFVHPKWVIVIAPHEGGIRDHH